MKKSYIWIPVFLIIILLSVFAYWEWRNLPDPEISAQYKVIFKEKLSDGQFLYGLVPKDAGNEPSSLIAVYEGNKPVYRFAPLVPADIGYPRPLELEKAWLSGEQFVTSWGETGADYFGAHPVVFRKGEDGKWGAVNFYEGNLSTDPRIKGGWTAPDFYVTNYFNRAEKVKTILTQGVSLARDEVELLFYADDRPHAESHDIVRLSFPLR